MKVKDNSGFSLIEVIVAMCVLTLTIIMTMSIFTLALNYNAKNKIVAENKHKIANEIEHRVSFGTDISFPDEDRVKLKITKDGNPIGNYVAGYTDKDDDSQVTIEFNEIRAEMLKQDGIEVDEHGEEKPGSMAMEFKGFR